MPRRQSGEHIASARCTSYRPPPPPIKAADRQASFFMSIPAVMRTMVLGVLASGAGLLASLYIVWIFGTAEFAVYTISLAKLSIILLGLELVPSQFSIFKMQHDPEFAKSISVFYFAFAILASALTAIAIGRGLIVSNSWLIVVYAFVAVTQRYIEIKTQSSGMVPAFGRMPAISNVMRMTLLMILGLTVAPRHPADAIWGSLCIGSAAGQLFILRNFPEVQASLLAKGPFSSASHLFAVRSEYYPYIINSVLKRAKDTFIPLVVDAAVPNRSVAGQVLVFFRASDAVCTQLRVLEMFLVNKNLRQSLKKSSRELFFLLSTIGLVATFALSLLFQYREGIDAKSLLYSFMIGTVSFPYVLEIIWRNEAYAAFAPKRVTVSLLAFLIGVAVPVGTAALFARVATPVLIFGVLAGQSMSAGAYYIWRRRQPLGAPTTRKIGLR